MVFSMITIGFFAGYSNFGIPQIKPAPPPQKEVLDLSTMTMDSIYRSWVIGSTTARAPVRFCHNELGGRAPMLDNMVGVSAKTVLQDSSLRRGRPVDRREPISEGIDDLSLPPMW